MPDGDLEVVKGAIPDSVVNPKAIEFLDRWDRSLPEERRHYGPKVLFAGAESKGVRDGLYRIGVRHILVSYFYLGKWLDKTSVGDIQEDLGRFDFVFLDSGGFTYLEALKDGKKLKMDVREYADHYYEQLPRFGHLFSGCAEVDIHEELSVEYMESRKEELLAKGVPIVPVIQGHNKQQLIELGWMDTYPYIAMGSAMVNEPKERRNVLDALELAKESGTLIHGFGATDASTVIRSEFYSVDSTTWLGGARYGNTMIFQNGRIRYYDHTKKDVRKRYRKRFEESGIHWEDVEADKASEVNLVNALAWKQWSDYVRYTATRSYWLTPAEKDHAMDLKTKAFNSEGLIDRKASIARADYRRTLGPQSPREDDRAQETLMCDSCDMSGKCPRYKPSNPCGYDINIDLNSKADLQHALQNVLQIQYNRVMTGALFEKLHGGIIDGNVSAELQRFVGLIQQTRGIFDVRPQETLTIQAKGGSGSIASALAGVFAPSGQGKSGSGLSQTERAAREAQVIDVESESSD